MRRFSCFLGLSLALIFAVPAFAGVGSIPDNGQHYNLNIIGVAKGKTVPMTDSSRHTIFVPLNTQGLVDKSVRIYYVPGPDFQVLDGNAMDANGATIQVPFEYCTDYTTGCEDLLSYNVYAVGLGKPNGTAVVEAHCMYTADVVQGASGPATTCEDTLLMGSFTIDRTKGQPKPTDITKVFRASGCLDLGGVAGVCDTGDLTFSNIWIFNIEQLDEYFWAYDNTNLKLMQVRFYPTTSGTIGYVK